MVLSALGPIAISAAADHEEEHDWGENVSLYIESSDGTQEELFPGWHYLSDGTYNMTIEYEGLEVGSNYSLRWWNHGGINEDYGDLEGVVNSSSVTDTWQMEVSNFDCRWNVDIEVINNTDGAWQYNEGYVFEGTCDEYGSLVPSAEINGTWVSEPDEMEAGDYNMSWGVSSLTTGEEYKLDFWYYLSHDRIYYGDMETGEFDHSWTASGTDETVEWNVSITDFHCTLQTEAVLWQNTSTGWDVVDQYWVGSWSEVIMLPCEDRMTAWLWADLDGDGIEEQNALANHGDRDYRDDYYHDVDCTYNSPTEEWACDDYGDAFPPAVEYYDYCYEYGEDEETGNALLACNNHYPAEHLEAGSYNVTLEIRGLEVGDDYWLSGELWEHGFWSGSNNYYELDFTAPTEEVAETVVLVISNHTCQYGFDLTLHNNLSDGAGNWHQMYLENLGVHVFGPCEETPAPFTLTYDDVVWEPEWQYEEFNECEEIDGAYECWNNDSWGYQMDVPIAFLYDMSGPIAFYAPGFLSSAEIAIEHLNDNQDIYNFSLEEYDTGCDGSTAAMAAQDAVDDGIELVVGALCSGASMGANSILSSYDIPHISPTSTSPDLSDSSSYPGFFRVIASDDMGGHAMADLVRGSNSSSPAVLYSSGDGYLGNVAETFIDDYVDGGGSICAELDVAVGETDLSDEAQALTDDSCDSVVIVTHADTAGPMLTELGDDGWSGEMFTHANVAYEIEAHMNDASDADGLQFIDPAGGPSDSERAEAFSEDCDNDSDCSNGIYTYENYDAFSLLAESFLLASAWGIPLEEAIHAVGYGWDGASSVVTFNDDGDVGGNGYDLCDLEYDSSNGSLVSGCDGHWDPPGFYYNANEVIDVYDVINGGSWFEECDDSSGVWICQTWWGWDNPDIDPGNHSMSWNITDLIDGVNYLFEYHVGIDTAMYGWEYGDVSHSFEASGNGQSDATHEIDWFLETDEYTCMVDIRAELWEDEDEDGVGDQPLGFGAYTFDGPCEEPPSPFTLYYDGNEYEVGFINRTDMDHCDEWDGGWECWFDYDDDGWWDEVHWFEDCANGSAGWECVAGWEYPYIDPGNHSMTLDMEGLEAGTSYGLEVDIHIGTRFGSEHEHVSLDFDATSDTYSTSGDIETSNYTCFLFINVNLFENVTDGVDNGHHFHFEEGFMFMGPCEEQPSPFTLVLEGEEYELDQNVFTDLDHCDELGDYWECYYDYNGDGWGDDWHWFEDCANGTDGWECIQYEPPHLEAGTYSGWLEVEGLEADGNYILEWRDRRCAWGGGCEEVEGDWGGPFNYSDLWDYNASSEIWTHDNFWIGLNNDTCDYFAEFSLREVEWDDETGDWFATNHLWFEVFHWFGPCEEPESPFTLYVDSNEYEMVPINMTGLDECIFYEDEDFEWFDCWIGYDWDGDGEDDWQDWYSFDECTNGTDGWECVEWMEHPGIDPGNHTMDLDIGDLAVDGSYKIDIEPKVCEEMFGCEYDWEELIFNATSANEAFSFFLDTDEYTCHVGLDVHLYEVSWDDNGNWWHDRHVYGEHFAFIGPCEERPAPADLYHDGVLWEEIVHYDQFDVCRDRGNNEFECQNEGWGHWEWRQNCEEQADGTWMCEGFRQLPALAPGIHDMLWNVTLIDLAASTSYVFFWEATHCENKLGCEDIDQGEEWWNNSDEYHDISWSLETSNYTCDFEVRGILVDASDGEEEMDEDDLIGIGFYKFRGPCEEPPSPVSLYTDGDLWEFIVHYDQFDDCQDRGNNEFECQNEGWGHWEWRQNCEEQADGTWMCEGWHQAPEIGPGNHSMTWEIEAEANTSYMIMWETYHHIAGEDWQYGSYDADWGTTWTTWNLETYNSTCSLDIHYDLYESIDYDGDGENDDYIHLWNDWMSFRGPCEEPPVPIYLWYDGTEHEQIEGLESWDECQMDYGDYRCWDYDGGDEWYDDCEYSDEDEVWYCIEEEDPDLTEGAHSMVWELTDLEVDVNYTLSWCVEQWSLFGEEDGGCDDESFDATNDWQEIAWDLTVSNYTCEVEILVELSSEVDWFYTYFHFNGPCEVPPMIDITVEIDEDGTMVELGGIPIEVVASNDGGDDLMPEDLVGFTDYHIDAGNHNLTITFHDLVVDDEYEYCVESGEWDGDGDDSCESFVADSTTYQVDLMTTVHPEACFWVVAAWLGNESRMVGWFGAVMYGPNFENCQQGTNVFEILEELVIEEEFWGDLAEVSGSSVMHVLEQARILHDDIRMKIDYDFGDGDGSLNESEAMMFNEMMGQMLAGPGWDGNCSTEEDFGPQDFTMNGESASCVTGHMWFENLANGSEGAPAWHIAFDATYNVTANADGQYTWSYEGDEAGDANDQNATFCGITSALGYAIEYWTHNGTAMTDCLSILAGELVGPIEVVWGVDTDADGIADANDLDDDGDGVADDQDAFPLDESEWSDNDGDGIGDNADTDDDNDGESDSEDRFPNDPSEWDDTDDDGVGDNADDFPFDPTETTDTDGDGWGDNSDAFPNDGTEWVDTDGDGTGDNADTDADGDGIDDDAEDSDGDGVYDDQDAFPFDANETTDTDGDGVGDNGDAFPNDANETTDTDGDGIGDNSDEDADGDGEPNDLDDFPLNGQESTDTDGDGVGDNEDEFPNDATETTDTDGDGIGDNADTDDDGDGVMDDQDAFPLDATESADTDGDGMGDNADAFPNDPMERQDADGDGVGDNADPFPSNPSEWADSDNDGTGDNSDAFPNDATEIADSDGDGVGNNADAFPNDSTETKDSDGDGVGDNAQAANESPPDVVEEEDDGGLLPGFSALMGVVSMLGAAVLIAGRRKD